MSGFLSIAGLLLASSIALGQQVARHVAWNHHQDGSIVGFKLEWGEIGGPTNLVQLPYTNAHPIVLEVGRIYNFRCASVSAQGVESEPAVLTNWLCRPPTPVFVETNVLFEAAYEWRLSTNLLTWTSVWTTNNGLQMPMDWPALFVQVRKDGMAQTATIKRTL